MVPSRRNEGAILRPYFYFGHMVILSRFFLSSKFLEIIVVFYISRFLRLGENGPWLLFIFRWWTTPALRPPVTSTLSINLSLKLYEARLATFKDEIYGTLFLKLAISKLLVGVTRCEFSKWGFINTYGIDISYRTKRLRDDFFFLLRPWSWQKFGSGSGSFLNIFDTRIRKIVVSKQWAN